MKDEGNGANLGMITSRKCPYCGHSEIGYTTPNGAFHSLKPGTHIQVLEMPEPFVSEAEVLPIPRNLAVGEKAGHGKFQPWVPAPLKGHKRLRAKYGVMIGEEVGFRDVTGHEYRSAFLRKIENLVEKEVHTPLPVILDRFFAAPHLASGNPRQIAQAMWRDLDEIRKPALALSEWLEQQSQETLSRVIHPNLVAELGGETVSDNELEAELQSLTLEEFLEML